MLLALALTSTLAVSPAAAPVRVDFLQARLDHSVGALVPSLAEGSIAGGISNIVAGSILTVLGGVSVALALPAVLNAPSLPENERTVSLVLGWTFTGFGGLLLVIGIPLLVVGIVRVATPHRGFVGLELGSNGQLAVRF